MTDKKNIVIKVKYPASGRAADYDPAHQMVTEWNVKRISLAAGVLVLLLGSVIYFINSDSQSPDSQNPTVLPEELGSVGRAVLTYEIKNQEPVGEITRPVKVKQAKPIMVYYYTELNKMNGRKVYHEWLKNGVIVSRQELSISADSWSASSRKLLTDDADGDWVVRLVDESGKLLNDKAFKVHLKK